MKDYLESYILDLLHINEPSNNKLLDLEANGNKNAYLLFDDNKDNQSIKMLQIIKEKIGKPASVCLLNSSNSGLDEQRLGTNLNVFEWVSTDGSHSANDLNKYIDKVYKELEGKGNNPLFLSVGALKWKMLVSKGKIKEVISPFLIFPIKLVRTSTTSPVYIEFVNDEAYINPCLIAKLKLTTNEDYIKNFPFINESIDEPIELDVLNDGEDYFNKVKEYILKTNDNATYEFDKNVLAIAGYNHDEICMYYDVKRNHEKMLNNELIKRIFLQNTIVNENVKKSLAPDMILSNDSVQCDIITRCLNGQNMIVKGPPGTGKTASIVNLVASALSSNKSVLVSSKKLAALSEIYNKLPKDLQKYVLLLDSDSEAKTANLSPKTIKKDLKGEINYIDKYSLDENIYITRKSLLEKKIHIIDKILKYKQMMFEDNAIYGLSFYEAIDKYLSMKGEPLITKINPQIDGKINLDNYNKLCFYFDDLSKNYDKVTVSRKYHLNDSPFIDFDNSSKIDEILPIYEKLNEYIEELSNKLKIKNVDIRLLKELIDEDLNEKELDYIVDNLNLFDIEKIKIYLDNLLNDNPKYYDYDDETIFNDYSDILSFNLDDDITYNDLKFIVDNKNLFNKENKNLYDENIIDELINQFNEIDNAKEKIKDLLFKMNSVYKQDLTTEELDSIYKAYSSLSYYKDNNNDNPRILDLKAKSIYKKLAKLSYLQNVSFKEIVEATINYHESVELLNSIVEKKQNIYKIFLQQIDDDSLDIIKCIVGKCDGTIFDYLESINEIFERFAIHGKKIFNDNNYSYKDLVEAYKTINDKTELLKAINGYKEENILKFAKDVLFINKLLLDNKDINVKKIFKELENKEKLSILFSNIIELFNKLNNEYNVNRNYPLKLNNLLIFASLDNDKENISYAINYNNKAKSLNNVFNLYEFVNLYENDQTYSLNEILEKSFLNEGISKHIKDSLDNASRYNLSKTVIDLYNEYKENEEELRKTNIKVIEANVIRRVNTKDYDFLFLDYERDHSSIRRLFKENTNGILKLKKCIIASPSTISLLFRRDSYRFDIAIVDEASQLEPFALLPVAFRTNSLVIVGDEYQMPPITHFETKLDKGAIENDEVINSIESGLDLALNNKGFDTKTLECHYRSKTESLIKFSQERFYDLMKTFPASVPFKDDLGFKDVYLEDAFCKEGVNEKEAIEAVNQIEKHFEKYFVDNTLVESIGVVCFGEKQVFKIESLIKENLELYKKIEIVKNNKESNISSEKIFFIKTIEKVQGQEIDHLVLSLTYGVKEDGKLAGRFGELNRKLGECIFNVAVTRAKKTITVLHSIHYYEIDDKQTISFIKDFLKISNDFSKQGLGQFVSSKSEYYFYQSVKDYIVALGFDKERVVINYGVTKGSIKIPVAILSSDKTKAVGGIFLENPTNNKYDYVDYNINYYDVLVNNNNWNLMRLFIYDWCFEKEKSKEIIKDFVSSLKEK